MTLAFWRWDCWKKLFHREDSRPAPGSVTGRPPAPPPVTQPARLGLPGQRTPVVLWFAEGGGLSDVDPKTKRNYRMELIAKYGLNRCKDLVVMGLSGVSQYGYTVRVLHDLLVDPLPADFAGWYRKNAAGCAGWALDWEDESKAPTGKAWCLQAVAQTPADKEVWFAPQLWLEGGRPPYRRTQWDQTHAQTVRDLEATKRVKLLLWQYGAAWPTWKSEMQRFRDEGFTGLLVPMNDGGAREAQVSQGYATVKSSVEIVHGAADEGLGFGVFMPMIDPERIAPVFAAIRERYSI